MNILLKAKYSFYSTLVYFLIANPETYKITSWLFNAIFGIPLATSTGCPAPAGLLVHTIFFFIVMLALMMFPRN
jgi:hypothetical protein